MPTQHSLHNATVVLTDASSRIGRATALTLARQGARLVLAARQAETLHELADDCQRLGAQVLVVAADRANPASAKRLARAAAAFGGRVDMWIDGAGHRVGGPLGPAVAPDDARAGGSGGTWLAAALLAGVAAGWYAWRRLGKRDDFSYYVTGGQL